MNKNSLNKTALLFIVSLFLFSACTMSDKQLTSSTETISANWKMQAVDKLPGVDEKAISESDFITDEWFDAVVPGTVLGSMASTGVIEDPYFGINMQDVSYEQFKQPWWFRTTFELDTEDVNKIVSLRFNGINYRADLWVNGKKVVGKDSFAGTFKMFTFYFTSIIIMQISTSVNLNHVTINNC